jgi:hypothetical protein
MSLIVYLLSTIVLAVCVFLKTKRRGSNKLAWRPEWSKSERDLWRERHL